jgi:hypothetical protein
MSVNLAAKANPLFLTRNYVDSSCVIAALNNSQAYVPRGYDMTEETVYTSVGSSDSIYEEYAVQFYEGSVLARRTVDFIAILGTNLKNFVVEWRLNDTGSSWATLAGLDYGVGVQDFALGSLLIQLAAPVDMDQIRLGMYRVRTGTEKYFQNFFVGQTAFQPARGLSSYQPAEDESNRRTTQLANGLKSESATLRSDGAYIVRAAHMGFRGVSAADRLQFRTLRRQLRALTVFPFPGDDPTVAYMGRFQPGSFRDPYLVMGAPEAGYAVDFAIEETRGG